jgi:hypothetical protein
MYVKSSLLSRIFFRIIKNLNLHGESLCDRHNASMLIRGVLYIKRQPTLSIVKGRPPRVGKGKNEEIV